MNLDLRLKTAPLSVASTELSDVAAGFIAGWASTPSIDSYKDIVAAGAFKDSIARRGLSGPAAIKLLLDHDADSQSVAGVITALEYRPTAGGVSGLWLEAQLNLDNPRVRNAYDAAKKVGGLNFSVGFRTLTWSFDEEANVLTVLTADLREVSLVVFPANEDCGMLVVKSEAGSKPASRAPDLVAPISLAEFEKMLVATGVVDTRNKAHRITLEVKQHSHLFRKTEDAQEAEPVLKVPPVPAVIIPDYAAVKAKADELSALVQRLG